MTERPHDGWRKSSFSGPNHDCVELRAADDGVLVRNSNQPEAGTLALTRGELSVWIAGCKAGDCDDLTD